MRETTLITGASSGIGLALARLFASDQSDLVLVARSEDKLQQLAQQLQETYGIQAHVIVADLAQPESSADIERQLAAESLQVDVLVNNAGFGALGAFTELPLERQVAMLQVNAMALTELTRRLLPAMVSANRGGILNVASVAAFQAGPNMAVYYASKAYVLSLTEALAEELSDTQLRISCLCPGPTKTEFGADSGMGKLDLFSKNAMTADAVARAGYRGFREGTTIVIPGVGNKLLGLSSKLAPRWLSRSIVRRLQRVD